MQPAAATLLNLPPISSLPPRTLPSEADYLCLRAGDTPAPCNVRNARAICEDEGGCKAKDKPCCLFKVKEIWSSAGFPMKERDDHIMRVLNKITKKHADKKKAFSSARLKEEDRAKIVEQIKNTTVNRKQVQDHGNHGAASSPEEAYDCSYGRLPWQGGL